MAGSPIRKIVVATDGSSIAAHAVRTALDLGDSLGEAPEVHVVAVVDYADVPAVLAKAPPDAPDLLELEAKRALHDAEEMADGHRSQVVFKLLHGHVTQTLLKYAHAAGADLIVLGTHGRRGIERALLGSVCEGVVRTSDIPVMTVHQ